MYDTIYLFVIVNHCQQGTATRFRIRFGVGSFAFSSHWWAFPWRCRSSRTWACLWLRHFLVCTRKLNLSFQQRYTNCYLYWNYTGILLYCSLRISFPVWVRPEEDGCPPSVASYSLYCTCQPELLSSWSGKKTGVSLRDFTSVSLPWPPLVLAIWFLVSVWNTSTASRVISLISTPPVLLSCYWSNGH